MSCYCKTPFILTFLFNFPFKNLRLKHEVTQPDTSRMSEKTKMLKTKTKTPKRRIGVKVTTKTNNTFANKWHRQNEQ